MKPSDARLSSAIQDSTMKIEVDGDVGGSISSVESSSLTSSNNAFHKSLPSSTRILSREEILQNKQGYQNNLILLMLDRKKNQWVPVLPDYTEAFHCMGGLVASGYPLRVLNDFKKNAKNTTQDDNDLDSFRLEVPQPGNTSRVFLRHFQQRRKEKNNNNVDDDDNDDDHVDVNPSYRTAPFLMFINDCLCVRAVPPHAVLNISRKSATAPDNKSWERLELRAPFSSFYTQGMSIAEHQAAFLLCGGDHKKEIHWVADKQRFVLMYKKVRKKIANKDKKKRKKSGRKVETESSDEFHTYEQRTWFVLARIDGVDVDDDDKKNINESKDQSPAMEKADADSVLAWKSAVSYVIEKYFAFFYFLFGFLLSKLGIRKSTTDILNMNAKKFGAGGSNGLDRVPDVGNEQMSCSPKETDVESLLIFRESRVVDQDTGESLTASIVVRGTVRCETLVFEIKAMKLVNLTRSVVTMKKVGFGYINVGIDSIELGTFESGLNQCDLPPQEVPSTSLAKGLYKIRITYTAENVQDKVLREETVEFTIV